MRFLALSVVVVGIVFGLVLQASAASPGYITATKTLDRFYDPIEMRGDLFSEMHNMELDRLGLLACHDGKLEFIPYQFDEWTEDGELLLVLGEDNNAEKANYKLDLQDQLVFMARDLGDKVEPSKWGELSSKGVEIEVIDPLTQDRGWAYLLSFSDKIPEERIKTVERVETTPEFKLHGDTFTLHGTTQTVGKKLYRHIVNSVISVKPVAGGNGWNFIDHNKVRVTVNLLFGLIKVRLDEDSFIGDIQRYYSGPVRGLVRQWTGFKMPLKLRSPRTYASIYVYDTMIIFPMESHVPINPDYVLTNLQGSIGYDLHGMNGRGMKYYSDTNPKGFLIDGRMDEAEIENYNDEPDDWRCIVGPQGWIMHRSLWDEGYRRQADIKMKYIDDVNHHSPPDKFPGDLGHYYTLSTIESLEVRSYFFQLDWYWPYRLYTPDGPDMKTITAICNIRDNPLKIRVGDREVENTAGVATPMAP